MRLIQAQAEIIREHGLVNLNKLLLATDVGGKAAGAQLVAALAGSPDFHKSASRHDVIVYVTQLLALESPRARIAAAGVCAIH